MLLSGSVYHLTFDDEFNALQLATGPGTDGWLPRDHWNNPYLSGNGEQQYYVNPLTENHNPFSINNGVLTIRAEPTPVGFDADGQPYVSGEITTATGAPYAGNPQGNGFSQTYGYYEVRAKLPAGKGLWPAFWLLRSNGSWPPEYDVFEVLGHDTDSIHQTAHWNNTSGQHQAQGFNYAGIVDSADGFHTYGFEWDADNIRWYIDGNLTQTQVNRVNAPMYMLLNLAAGGYWPGNPDGTTPWPADMEIDYVRVYSTDPAVPAVTPQSGYSVSSHLPVNVGQVQQQPNVLAAIADAYVRDGSYAGVNYDGESRLIVKNHGTAGSGYNRESYLKFDLSGQSSIADAKLRLYLNPRAGANTVDLGVFAAADTSWSETGLTWSNKPATSGGALDTVTVTNSKNGQWVEWDVSGYLQQEKAAGRDTVTLVLRSLTADNNDVFLFTADEASVVTAPELVITPGTSSSVTLGVAADAYVQSGAYANNKYGSSSQLIVKNSGDSGSNWNRESFLKFDLSSVAGVGSGKVRLYLPPGVGTESTTLSLYGVSNTSWSESSITWNNRPAASTGALASVTVTNGTSGAWYEWDVSGYLQQEKAAGRDLVTLVLKAEGVSSQYYAFTAEEASGTEFDPQLVIDAAAATPVETELAVVADAYVRDGSYANNNYGSDASLLVKNAGGSTGFYRESYLKFDLTSASVIDEGILRLYLNGTSSVGTASIGVYAATDTSWNEGAITWNNKPAISGGALASVSVSTSTAGAWYEWDVTSYLQQEKAAGRDLVTLVVRSDTFTNPAFTFSAEETTGADFDPRLVITSSGSQSLAAGIASADTGATTTDSSGKKSRSGNSKPKQLAKEQAILAYYVTQMTSTGPQDLFTTAAATSDDSDMENAEAV